MKPWNAGTFMRWALAQLAVSLSTIGMKAMPLTVRSGPVW